MGHTFVTCETSPSIRLAGSNRRNPNPDLYLWERLIGMHLDVMIHSSQLCMKSDYLIVDLLFRLAASEASDSFEESDISIIQTASNTDIHANEIDPIKMIIMK